MNAFVFPGQGSQFVGMGKALYEKHPIAKQHFDLANKILGFGITEIMFNGTAEADEGYSACRFLAQRDQRFVPGTGLQP